MGIHTEVVALLAADKNLTQANCDKKCDAIFALLAQKDETLTDRVCHHECDCVIHNNHNNHNQQQNNGLEHLVHNEVMELMKADPSITEDNCNTKCDAIFSLLVANDENKTDNMCHHECDCL